MKTISYTTTLTSKGQFTVPKPIRDRLAVQKGTKFEVIYSSNGFIAKPKSNSNILDLEGILKDLDDGKPTDQIIKESLVLAAKEIAKK